MIARTRNLHIVFLLMGAVLLAQNGEIGNRVYTLSQFSLTDARKIHLAVAQKGFESADLLKKIADSYYFEEEYDDAVLWYGKLIARYPSQAQQADRLRYAQSLRAVNNTAKADEVLASLHPVNPSYSGRDVTGKYANQENTPERRTSEYTLEDIGLINSKYSDFAPMLYQGKLIFATDGQTQRSSKKAKKQSNAATTDIYQSQFDNNLGYYTSPKPFDEKLNSKDNESTTTFTKDGNTVYFTRKDGGRHKIYSATKKKGKWGKPSEMPFNSNTYATEHPALNGDNTRLYFASNMPGTVGLMDIWYVDIKKNGGYGPPVNLGEPINTMGKETYPFISDSGNLYFASNEHPGLGGLDIFVTNLYDLKNAQPKIKNLGKPINSAFDDFSIVLKEEEQTGFFASNRDAGLGQEDIYKFRKDTSCRVLTSGVILEGRSNQAIAGVQVALIDLNNTVIDTAVSDDSGRYSFTNTRCGTQYIVRGTHSQYSANEVFFTTQDTGGTSSQTLFLDSSLKSLKVGDDLTKVLDLNAISFDVDRFNIQGDAALELEKVIAFMNANPSLKIDVRSHTDSRSRDSYNQLLSNKRNTSTIAYLIDNGIHKRRLSGKGYGESQPLNRCSNGVKCSEEEHQRNRRSEFIVVKI